MELIVAISIYLFIFREALFKIIILTGIFFSFLQIYYYFIFLLLWVNVADCKAKFFVRFVDWRLPKKYKEHITVTDTINVKQYKMSVEITEELNVGFKVLSGASVKL